MITHHSRALRARQRRLAEGERTRQAERASFAQAGHRAPTHTQLFLPLLEALAQHGGEAFPRDLYGPVAEKTRIDPAVQEDTITLKDGRVCNLWHRHLRWARQTAVEKGLIATGPRGKWAITDAGRSLLQTIRRGIILTAFTTEAGICLWANAEDAAAVIDKESIDLIFTSPPFPLLTDSRQYGTMEPASWLDWMTDLGHAWKELLVEQGSLIVHLGECWYRGTPTLSTYIERFVLRMVDTVGLHLAQRLYAEYPTRLPSPRPWVAIRRVRVKTSVDPVLWFSRSPNPRASNWNVRVPYAPSTKRGEIGRIENGGVRRPGGQTIGKSSFATDNGGAIPGSLIRCTGLDASVRAYRARCKETGRRIHPAIMPRPLADYCLRLTTEEGSLVYDPFFGSGTTGDVAEALGRRWIGSERALVFAEGAALRFVDRPGFVMHP